MSYEEFQKNQCAKRKKYCESLAERMKIISYSPIQPHPIFQKPIAAIRNFSHFFNHIFNSAIPTLHKIGLAHPASFQSTQMSSDNCKANLKYTHQPESLIYNSETCLSTCLYLHLYISKILDIPIPDRNAIETRRALRHLAENDGKSPSTQQA